MSIAVICVQIIKCSTYWFTGFFSLALILHQTETSVIFVFFICCLLGCCWNQIRPVYCNVLDTIFSQFKLYWNQKLVLSSECHTLPTPFLSLYLLLCRQDSIGLLMWPHKFNLSAICKLQVRLTFFWAPAAKMADSGENVVEAAKTNSHRLDECPAASTQGDQLALNSNSSDIETGLFFKAWITLYHQN